MDGKKTQLVGFPAIIHELWVISEVQHEPIYDDQGLIYNIKHMPQCRVIYHITHRDEIN